jgi:uncharacterized membrane protein YcaP (DUF421 family)
MEPYIFDLQRIFFGDMSPAVLLEIAFRTAFLFVFTMLLFRMLGARTLSQLSIAEIALIIGLGSAVGDPMLYPDVPLVHGMMVITVVVVLQRLMTRVSFSSRLLRTVIDPAVVRLVADGRVDERGVRRAHLTLAELYGELRQHDVENVSQVRRAYMESDGSFSVFLYRDDEPGSGTATDLIVDADEGRSR